MAPDSKGTWETATGWGRRDAGAERPTGARHAGRNGLKLSVDAAINADFKRARFSAAAMPTWHFSCAAWLCRQLQQGTDGARGTGAAVGAVGATFHVATCAHWHGVGARATWGTWKARHGTMT